MKGFTNINKVIVPLSCVHETHSHLAEVGREQFEGFALWIGKEDGDVFRVERTIIPEQEGLRSEDGVCVSVGGDELHRINVELYQNKQLLIAQIHSHPTEAYHSTTDDTYPIATTIGSLSLVVPDFAINSFELRECAVYRLEPTGRWTQLTESEVESLIIIE